MSDLKTPTNNLGLKAQKALFLSFLLAFILIRLFFLPNVFGKPYLNLIDPDSYYHLRRILYTFENYPSMLIFDPFLSYPEGDFVPWPPLFDFLSATLIMPFKNPIYLVCSINLLISAAIFLVVYLYQKQFGVIQCLISLLIITTSGSLIKIGSFGSIDHHILEVFFVLSFYLLWLEKPFSGLINNILIVILVSLSFFNWPGAMLYYAPVLVILIYNYFKGKAEYFNITVLSLSFFVAGFLIELYFMLNDNNVHSYSFKYLSNFQRDVCILLGGEFILFYFLQKKKINLWIYFVFSVAILLLFYNIFFEISKGLNYLKKGNDSALMKMVSESNPIIFSGRASLFEEIVDILIYYTPFVFLYPFIVWKFFKMRINFSLLIVSLYFFLLSCIQVRLSIFFVPFLAILCARFLENVIKKISFRYLIAGAMVFYIIIFVVWFKSAKFFELDRNVSKTMWFLQNKTPLSYEFENGNTPYGILSSWHMGHYIITLGDRPAAAHNFIAVAKNNKEREFLRCVFAKNEAEVLDVMKKNLTPFLVISDIENNIIFGWKVMFEGENPYFAKVNDRFEPTEKVTELFLYNLMFDLPTENLRVIFESSDLSQNDKTIVVVESVKGVRLVSKEKGVVNVILKTPYRNITLNYSPYIEDGKYVFKIPYSTKPVYDVYAEKILFTGKKVVELNVSEEDVIFGRQINI